MCLPPGRQRSTSGTALPCSDALTTAQFPLDGTGLAEKLSQPCPSQRRQVCSEPVFPPPEFLAQLVHRGLVNEMEMHKEPAIVSGRGLQLGSMSSRWDSTMNLRLREPWVSPTSSGLKSRVVDFRALGPGICRQQAFSAHRPLESRSLFAKAAARRAPCFGLVAFFGFVCFEP